jgi:glutathione S-transferase
VYLAARRAIIAGMRAPLSDATGTPAARAAPGDQEEVATLYVIPGSHACRTAMLALAHKGIVFRPVELPTGLHPLIVRLLGFPGSGGRTRSIDGGSTAMLATMNRLGTVPALRFRGRRVQGNRAIVRRLEEIVPEPPLYPADAALRLQVEEAERWGDEVLQMAARRIALAASLRGLDTLHARGESGRLGPLLAHGDLWRMVLARASARTTFAAGADAERELLIGLPAMLDRVDAWIAAGVLGGEAVNAADLMIAPSLALLDYRIDLSGELRARPCGALMSRLLPGG